MSDSEAPKSLSGEKLGRLRSEARTSASDPIARLQRAADTLSADIEKPAKIAQPLEVADSAAQSMIEIVAASGSELASDSAKIGPAKNLDGTASAADSVRPSPWRQRARARRSRCRKSRATSRPRRGSGQGRHDRGRRAEDLHARRQGRGSESAEGASENRAKKVGFFSADGWGRAAALDRCRGRADGRRCPRPARWRRAPLRAPLVAERRSPPSPRPNRF